LFRLLFDTSVFAWSSLLRSRLRWAADL